MSPYQIIKRPLISEKGTKMKDEAGQFFFAVHPDATKPQIRQAIQKLFKVKVIDVHTASVGGKTKRVGKNIGKKPDWKKAFVTLAPGQKIELFEA